MFKKRSRIWPVLAAIVLAAGLLAGCKSSVEDKAVGNETGDGTAADAEKPYEIVIELMPMGMGSADLKEVEAAINEMVLPKINCTVRLMEIPIADHVQKVSLLSTGGDKMDLIIAGLTTTPSTLQSTGVLMPVTKELYEYAPDLAKKLEPMIDACKIGGEIYAIPMFLYTKKENVFYYNAEMGKQYDLDLPDSIGSYADLTDVFKTIKDSGMSAYPTSAGDGVLSFYINVDGLGDKNNLTYGALMNPTKDTGIVNYYATDEFEQLCRLTREWYELGYLEPDSLSNGNNSIDSARAGVSFGNYGAVGATGVSASEQMLGMDLETVAVREPVVLTTGTVLDYSYGVSSACENPRKVMEFLNLVYTDVDLMNLLNYGIEGKHYVKVSENIITYPEGINGGNVGFGNAINVFGDESMYYQMAPLTEDYFINLNNFSVESAEKSKAFGYTFDATSVKTEVAAVTSVIGTYRPSLICGVADVDEVLPEFRKVLETAGIGKIIEENQKQFDAWLAK